MSERGPVRPVTTTQAVGILASTLALFFLVAFVTKAVDAYRLRNWRSRLEVEIAQMTNERQELEQELQRRQSAAWIDEVLRDAGQVPEGGVSVIAVTVVPSPGLATPTPSAGVVVAPRTSERPTMFDNPQWRAWLQLLGFD
jgi:hypothetical protein